MNNTQTSVAVFGPAPAAIFDQEHAALESLKKSLLHQAFSGHL
jgi:hypothetical protein